MTPILHRLARLTAVLRERIRFSRFEDPAVSDRLEFDLDRIEAELDSIADLQMASAFASRERREQSMTMNDVRQRMGELLLAAIGQGGDALMAKVDDALGVAHRHLARCEAGELRWSSGVESEVLGALRSAERILSDDLKARE